MPKSRAARAHSAGIVSSRSATLVTGREYTACVAMLEANHSLSGRPVAAEQGIAQALPEAIDVDQAGIRQPLKVKG